MKIYHTMNKSEWGAGPWQDEPDKASWTDPATGFPCLVVRNGGGALCGYVGVEESHPAYQKEYDELDLSVHGGLTYSAPCQHGSEEHSICRIPEPGKPDNIWWLGFDCLHCDDFGPAYASRYQSLFANRPSDYKTFNYVKSEIESLALQLKEMTNG